MNEQATGGMRLAIIADAPGAAVAPAPRRAPNKGPGLPLLALVAAFVIGGCASLPPPSAGEATFDLKGRFSVVEGGRARSGNFFWRQHANGFEAELWGPLGQGRTRLIGKGHALQVMNARGETMASDDAKALMQRELGWAAPLSAFGSWFVGEPAPSWPARTRGDAFEQLGWRVRVTAWAQVGERALPRRLEARHGGLRIVVACREWRLPQG